MDLSTSHVAKFVPNDQSSQIDQNRFVVRSNCSALLVKMVKLLQVANLVKLVKIINWLDW